MKKFTYVVLPWGFEVQMIAATQKEARKLAWNSLTQEQQDNCEDLDWVDEEPLTPS